MIESAYDRESKKAALQELGQKIARIEAGENIPGADINKLHAEYDQMESELNEQKAA